MSERNTELNELITEIRQIDASVSRARVKSVRIDAENRSVRVVFISDKAVPDDVKTAAANILLKYIPESFEKVVVEFKKSVADEELIKTNIIKFFKERFPTLSAEIVFDNIAVEMGGDKITYLLNVSEFTAKMIKDGNKLSELNAALERTFCNDFSGATQVDENAEVDNEPLQRRRLTPEYTHYRSISVYEVVPIDRDFNSDTAIYIDDIKGEMDSVILCGEVLEFKERATKTGKPYFNITFTDKTAKISGNYFNKKQTEKKIRELRQGDGIIIQGKLENYRGSLSLTIQKLNRCVFPKDFKPDRKEGNSCPSEYKTVFPKPLETTVQRDMLNKEEPIPDCLLGKTFVVFDLETTGKEATEDKITEIGGVKIVDGKMVEYFETLVNPKRALSEEIIKLTGITDDMLKDAPFFEDVAADFFKWTRDAILVAHFIDFDYKFIKKASEPLNYYYYNEGMDTYLLSRELLPQLKNHKLNTVAEHYKLDFNHHRAFQDAQVTAEIFLRLIRAKKCLPN